MPGMKKSIEAIKPCLWLKKLLTWGTAARDGQGQGELPQPPFWGCWRGRGSWLGWERH